jgi:hypothetical protein
MHPNYLKPFAYGIRLSALVAGLLPMAPLPAAESDYKRLLDQGDAYIRNSQTAFEKGNIAERIDRAQAALKCYQQAELARPGQNLDAIYGEGFAWAQMGDYQKALAKYAYLKSRDYPSPNLKYATGVALVHTEYPGTKGFLKGIGLLKEYVGDAGGHELSADYLYLCPAKYLVNQAEHLDQPNTPPAAKLVQPSCQLASPEPAHGKWITKPIVYNVSSGVGFNDNVPTLAKHAALPPRVGDRSALFSESTFLYTHDFTRIIDAPGGGVLKDDLLITYLFQADELEDFSTQDQLQNTVIVGYTKSFTPSLAGLLKLSDQWNYVNQDLNGNKASLQSTFRFSPVAPLTTQLSYTLTRYDGYANSLPPTNPAGFSHKISLDQSIDLITDRFDFSRILSLTLSYSHQWVETKGIETKHEMDDLSALLTWNAFHRYDGDKTSLVRSVSLVVAGDWIPDHYLHDTYPMNMPEVDHFALEHDTSKITVSLTTGLGYNEKGDSRLQAAVQYTHTYRDANVPTKSYDQNMILGLIKYSF